MKIMVCPINGARSISEFVYGGEMRSMPDSAMVEDKVWADYVFNHNNAPAIKKEWWCHASSNTWFIAERNTANDEILRTYLFSEDVE